jgi:hypothetical protein
VMGMSGSRITITRIIDTVQRSSDGASARQQLACRGSDFCRGSFIRELTQQIGITIGSLRSSTRGVRWFRMRVRPLNYAEALRNDVRHGIECLIWEVLEQPIHVTRVLRKHGYLKREGFPKSSLE